MKGITGTNYYPPDNEYQIRKALENSCRLINGKENIFEKALLALILSYPTSNHSPTATSALPASPAMPS